MDWEKILALAVSVMTVIYCVHDCSFVYSVILCVLAAILGASVIYRSVKLKSERRNDHGE